ncbi:hypothetical protein B0H10DRAFT_1962901, partial [Mycena sp. CBHHK59/15]
MIDEEKDGFYKFISNGDAIPVPQVANDKSLSSVTEFLSFTQHVQYHKTVVRCISLTCKLDWEGLDIFGDGNVPAAIEGSTSAAHPGTVPNISAPHLFHTNGGQLLAQTRPSGWPKYRLKKKIGSGSFGDIYLAINVVSGEEVAVKLEPVNAKYPLLEHETKVYKFLRADWVFRLSDGSISRATTMS